MTINPLANIKSDPLPPVNSSSSVSGTSSTSSNTPVDETKISPLAWLQNLLQQIHDNRSERFTSITAQIADKLRTAATKAQTNGHAKAADELNEVAGQFQIASQTGQPPSLWALRHPIAAIHNFNEAHPIQEGPSPETLQTLMDAANSAGLS